MSKYLAKRTCGHVIRSGGGEDSKYSRGLIDAGLFDVEPVGNRFSIWNGYRIEFRDEMDVVKIVLNRGIGVSDRVVGRLSGMRVPQKYRAVISGINVYREENSLVLEARMSGRDNASGRMQNEDKLFFAIHNSITKPIFSAASIDVT